MSRNNLTEWLTYLESLHPKAIDLSLDRVRQVAHRLQLLPYNIPAITIGGTNGKGSCVALLAEILTAAGAKVGIYTSPHLLRFNERITINGQACSDKELCETFQVIEDIRQEISLTYFEFTTLAALWLFQKAKVDIVILEVGLGGRLDAVNIIDPEVSIIATIALDHTEWLGDNREAIGYEKAGIFRSGKLAICGDFNPPKNILNYAKQIAAPLLIVNRDYHYQVETINHHVQTWTWWNQSQKYDGLPIPKIALQNAATVLAAITHLPESISKSLSQAITQELIAHALKKVKVLGRFQIFPGPVATIVDVAHNPAAGECLAKQIQAIPNSGKTIAVVGILADKDIAGILQYFINLIEQWHVAAVASSRSATAATLTNCLQEYGVKNINNHATITHAYKSALAQARVGDRIIVFGSFYTVAEVLQLLH